MGNAYFRMMCAATGVAAAILGGATAASAQQQDPSTTIIGQRAVEDGYSVRVPYGDLNLTAARDERALYYRVKTAAKSVCAPNDDLFVHRPFSRCVGSAMTGAQPQIDLAVRRARAIAATGTSSIPLVAIAVVAVR